MTVVCHTLSTNKMKNKQANPKRYKLNYTVARRITVVTLAYLLFMTIVWGTVARQFPNGVQPTWLLWLIIGLSIALYFVAIIVVEWLNYKRTN